MSAHEAGQPELPDPRHLAPEITQAAAKAKHGNSLPWRLFAVWITRNHFMRHALADRQDGQCAVCEEPIALIAKASVHHRDYDFKCRNPSPYIKVFSPTEMRPDRFVRAPDCASCAKKLAPLFNSCMSRLSLVHTNCHGKIHDKREKPAPQSNPGQ